MSNHRGSKRGIVEAKVAGDYVQIVNCGGYLANREITNLPGQFLIQGSQNVFIKNNEKVYSRNGYSVLGIPFGGTPTGNSRYVVSNNKRPSPIYIPNSDLSAAPATAIFEEVPLGSGTTFTILHIPVANTLRLYRGGTRQRLGASADYTLSGLTITLSTALSANEVLVADYFY